MKRFFTFLAMTIAACTLSMGNAVAAPAEQPVKIIVMPDRADWNYTCGEVPCFKVLVLKNHVPMQNVEISYLVSEDMMPAHLEKSETLKTGEGKIKIGTMKKPGFLRCTVYVKSDGYTYRGMATAAFEPEKIQPTTTLPDDFDKFWSDAIAANAQIPMNATMTLMPELCTGTYNAYHIRFQSFKEDSYMYGVLTIPVKEGKYPAILRVPGAGVKPMPAYKNLPNDKAVILQVGVNGIPVNMPKEVYRNLDRGALRNYNRFRVDDRDNYYYKRVYLGCARAVDFLAELDCVDAEKIAVCGGSQGGALSITTAVLNPKVKCLYANYPALCDLTGYLNGRGGGWPHFFRGDNDSNLRNVAAIIENLKYFDVVNFARKANVPVKIAFGYNDTTCCPTSILSAVNVITAPKELLIYNEIGHYTYPELEIDHGNWILKQLQ